MTNNSTKPTPEEIEAKIRENVKARFLKNGNPITASHVYDYGLMELYSTNIYNEVKVHEILERTKIEKYIIFIVKNQGPIIFRGNNPESQKSSTSSAGTLFTDPVHMLKSATGKLFTNKKQVEDAIESQIQSLKSQLTHIEKTAEDVRQKNMKAIDIRDKNAAWIAANFDRVDAANRKAKKQEDMKKSLNLAN